MLSRGVKKNNRISLLLIGQDGVGKTSLKKSIFGEAIDQNEPSTIGIEYDVVEVKEDNKAQPWKLAEDSQFIGSKGYAENVVGKQVAKEIVDSEKRKRNKRVIGFSQRRPADEPVDKDEHAVEDESRDEPDYRDEFLCQVEKGIKSVGDYYDDTMDIIRFLVGDFAGLSVYYDVHSIMLRYQALSIVVVDLSKSLYDEAHPKFFQKGTKRVELDIENPLKETNLDYIIRWMAALRNLSPCNEEGKPTSAQRFQMPKTILVFTKPDRLRDPGEVEGKREEFVRILEERFKRIGCEILAKYVIRNTEPRNAAETKELENLRAKIFETAQNLLKEQKETPVSWLMLERALDTRRKDEDLKHRPYIALEEARTLFQEFSKIINENFEDAMKFLHQENIVVHISENEALNNLVVLDANWLVQLFTKVLTVEEDTSWSSTNTSAWRALREKGELQFDNLPNALDDLSQKESLKMMMVNAGLIFHRKDDTYLVPSMVTKRLEESDIREVLSSCLQPSLYIDFKDETIPLAFYTRFQVELLILARLHARDDEMNLYHNFMLLPMIEDDVRYEVIFIRHVARIEVAIKVDEEIEWVCLEKCVLNFLSNIVKKIQTTHPCCKGLRYQFGLKCDLCCSTNTSKCSRHGEEDCDDGDCVCIMILEDLKRKKPFCPNKKYGKVSSKLCEVAWFKAFDNRVKKRSHPEDELMNEIIVLRKSRLFETISSAGLNERKSSLSP